MGVVEIVAAFSEALGALVLAAAFLLAALWLWRRPGAWPVAVLGVLFLLEIVYLAEYDWGVTGERAMIIVTLAVAGIGFLAAIAWFVQRRRTSTAAST
jgi:hypothetical protein